MRRRANVKALPDTWLGVHYAHASAIGARMAVAPRAIGDAQRCCPIPKLSPGGQLCIRQSDLGGLPDGFYRFALYSRHLCVAATPAIEFRNPKGAAVAGGAAGRFINKVGVGTGARTWMHGCTRHAHVRRSSRAIPLGSGLHGECLLSARGLCI